MTEKVIHIEQEEIKEDVPIEEEQAITSLVFQNRSYSAISELVEEARARLRLLLKEQREKDLIAQLETFIREQASIGQFMLAKTDFDNRAFLNSRSSEDKDLLLLVADKEFIDSLSTKEQHRAQVVHQMLAEEENVV